MTNPYKSHPWHGVPIGDLAPAVVTAFIEITPSDTVKYEIDKASGILKVDRPQLFSNVVPALYGFIPQTYCKDEIAKLCMDQTGMTGIEGDGDPLDILVLTEHRIVRGDILVQAIPIGGLKMIDDHQADDKIIAVLQKDAMYAHIEDIFQLPDAILQRLKHYFLTYKLNPGKMQPVEIPNIYGKEEAMKVIEASRKDYNHYFGQS
ncbi:MAG: inorganic pyrophosphatase [Saprospiraceae bacterium]|uniref:inorganic diphosphatase n=1 Tax=Candidatus Opimibacter skivensis TaxID=2982028 RepID=A0A9D7SWW2_9BACT|nr:inorganic pyrophosphatase [Candidatus Opimibacter skivensis]